MDITDRKINLEDKSRTTFEKNLKHPDKEFELTHAINLRMIIAKSSKSRTKLSKGEAQQLLDNINDEVLKNLIAFSTK